MDHSVAGATGAFSSVFMLLLISLAMINQLHVFAYDTRELFEVREALSNTFHWSCLLLSHTFLEIYWSTICEFLCFVCYYFPAQYSGTAENCGYFFFIYVLIFPIYFCSYGLWILYMSPDVPSASMINSNLFASMLLFCGILNPKKYSPGFWSFMYVASPFTYFVQAFVAPLVHNRELVCTFDEYSIMDPPAGETCGSYLAAYIDNEGGYVANPEEDAQCKYCPYRLQSEVVLQYDIKWSYRWRNFGIAWIYILFNFGAMLVGYYVVRVKVWDLKSVMDIKNWWSPRKERHEKESNLFKPRPGDEKIGNATAAPKKE
ncbi:unnamed protein product [[Candida] boidinii]|nr:unnamed protein product [[Candida] boidinii]